MLDVALLRIMKYRNEYFKLRHALPKVGLDAKTAVILDDFGKYFEKFDHDKIDFDVFIPRFRLWHPGLSPEAQTVYSGILRNLETDSDTSTREGILGDLYELDLATRIANYCNDYDLGTLKSPLHLLVSKAMDEFSTSTSKRTVDFVDDDIYDLLNREEDTFGVNWRLKCLQQCMRPLRGGDFGIVAGRPDKGKTSFLASELTYMAPQLKDQPVLWLNNEGPGQKIKTRLYIAAFGMSVTNLREYSKDHDIRTEYKTLIKNDILIKDIHDWDAAQVQGVIEYCRPGIVVFDMIDKIKGFSGDQSRTDQQLEEMYDWARNKCVQYDMIGIATSQISNEGDGLAYPGLGMLKDSKTGKQGACDFQLMIGASNEEALQSARYLSMPKNKLRRDGFPKDPRTEVIFNQETSRYEDIAYGH